MTNPQEMRFPTPDGINLDEVITSIQSQYRVLEEPVYQVGRVFLDSFDWRLHAGKVTLWTEQSEEGTSVYQNGIPKAPHRIRVAAPGACPGYPEDLPPGQIRETAARLLGARALLPQVEVKSRIRCLRLLDVAEKTVLRVMIEKNASRAPGKRDYISCGTCIRLLPVRGYPQPLTAVANLLNDGLGVTMTKQGLIDEALGAIGKSAENYSTKLNFEFDPAMRSDHAAKQIHLFLLDIIEANVPGVKSNLDSEFLHDMRVAVRRTRSALTQLKGVFDEAESEKFNKRMAWIGEITGPTRDMDVFLLGFGKYLECIPERFHQDLTPLHLFLENHQRMEHHSMVNKINSPHFRRSLKEWRNFLEMPVGDAPQASRAATPILHLANKRIYKMFQRVVKQGTAITDESPAVDLHRLRKECKKLRYLMEFFQGLYPKKKISDLIKSLKKLLDNLGDFQDFEVQADKIREYARQMVGEGAVPHATLMAMGMLIDGLLRRQQNVRNEFANCFADFSQADNQGTFRLLFAGKNQKGKV